MIEAGQISGRLYLRITVSEQNKGGRQPVAEHSRKMALTDADLSAIVEKMREEYHPCRYDISPEDMRANYEFVKAFRDGAIETRRTFRTMMIRMIVWGSIAGFIALLEVKFRWFRPLMRFLTGAPG